MSAQTVAFVGALTYAFPSFLPVLEEHLRDLGGEVLPHVYLPDIERWAESAASSDPELLRGVLSWLEEQYELGDPEVRELIDVSFLELLSWPGKPGSEVRALLGPAMAETARRPPFGPG